MKLKLTYCILLFFLLFTSYAQEKMVSLTGTITSNSKAIENVHVYNITKRIGAVTNNLGKFQINASFKDTLYVSSLQYKKTTVVVTAINIDTKELVIGLTPVVNELDEVFLRHLTGNLKADMANKPKDNTPKIGYVYHKKDLYKTLPPDSYEKSKRPDAQSITDPLGPLSGGAGLPDKRYQALLKQKREFALRKKFPEKLKNEFGIEYFTNDLKIKETQINNFLTYCEYFEIFEKYYNNNILEVIQILKDESKTYNNIKR
ncbi:CarboxypepD_reg-like domain-containing protein [Lutibacter agarilyticus]|uniref:CarboxypepD_reg-like domain-containing protein n=1 Tax=Lutibacter agarilyticus TaxID=1109740 RepID=A0A238WV90_9FLAO|nr:carboxypeptidase-like regulatory domain-containing protein [Lutibacter agarilyticus]SNR50485.1 CarboxypepD_reg-like domain-containing protein [Lutibacter agarilyticus]